MVRNEVRGRVAKAPGLTPTLHRKAKARRETGVALTETTVHTPRRNDLTPQLKLTRVRIAALKPAPRRVRRSDKVQAGKLDASLAKFGHVQPLLVDADNAIIHGHGVYEALRRAGVEDVSVIYISHLSATQLRSLAITLNRLGETGSWDEDALKLEFAELMDLGEDLVLTGFDVAEIDGLLLEEDEAVAASDGVDVPQPPPTSEPNDVWLLGRHRLIQADALLTESYTALFSANETARVVLSDPPFNVPNVGHTTSSRSHREFAMAAGEMSREQFRSFLVGWLKNVTAHVVDGGLLLVFMDWRSIEILLAAGREVGLDLLNLIVWSKTNGGQGSLWRSQHELIAVFKKGRGPHTNNVALGRWGRWRSNVWVYPGGSSLGSEARAGLEGHPTPKPRALLEDALLDISDPGDVVIDCFLGSGSTLLAAETTGRTCRAMEIDGVYCDLAIERWQSLTGKEAVLQETGKAFRQVSAHRAGKRGASKPGLNALDEADDPFLSVGDRA
jgi:DNA modification methylase